MNYEVISGNDEVFKNRGGLKGRVTELSTRYLPDEEHDSLVAGIKGGDLKLTSAQGQWVGGRAVHYKTGEIVEFRLNHWRATC